MYFALNKAARYGIGIDAQSEEDCYRICAAEQIEIIWNDGKHSWYMTVEGKAYIVLSIRLRGLKLVFAMFHELAHHFLHFGATPNQSFFQGLVSSKDEIEADAIALIALIPKSEIDSYEFLETHPNRYAKKLYKERQKLGFLFGV